jgi:hypothetical protein
METGEVCLWLHPDLPDVPKAGPVYPQLRKWQAPAANGEF